LNGTVSEKLHYYLKGIFPGHCVASEGPILWLAQFPDDDPTRYVKNMAYQGNLNKMGKPERYTADTVAEVEKLHSSRPLILSLK
jgi:hypothetical protein